MDQLRQAVDRMGRIGESGYRGPVVAFAPLAIQAHVVAAIVAVVLGFTSGCHRADPCASSQACPEDTVCQHDGTCGPLGKGEDLRFAARRGLEATDWAVANDDGSAPGSQPDDVLPLGGPHGAVAHLAFGPLPTGVRIVRATLSLRAHPSWTGSAQPWRVGVHEGPPPEEARQGEPKRRRYHPPRRAVRLPTGMDRALFIDVTPFAAEAVDRGDRQVTFTVRVLDRGTPLLRFASPQAIDPARRPRVHLSAD